MEARRGSRLLTQRLLEVDPVRPPPAPPTVPNVVTPAPSPTVLRSASEPVRASNDGLLARQQRWQLERAKFESTRSSDERSK